MNKILKNLKWIYLIKWTQRGKGLLESLVKSIITQQRYEQKILSIIPVHVIQQSSSELNFPWFPQLCVSSSWYCYVQIHYIWRLKDPCCIFSILSEESVINPILIVIENIAIFEGAWIDVATKNAHKTKSKDGKVSYFL